MGLVVDHDQGNQAHLGCKPPNGVGREPRGASLDETSSPVSFCQAVTKRIILQGGTLITLDQKSAIRRADLLIEDDRIAEIGGEYHDGELIDCRDKLILPGLVQAHVHLCQALFRGLAEETDLLSWLSEKIWPLEAAHSRESLATSSRLGLLEMIRSGTTTICDMGSLAYPEAIAEVVKETGVRAVVSKLLMDTQEGAPGTLLEPAREGMAAAQELHDQFHGKENGRIRVAVAPRFVLSCSRELLEQVARFSEEREALVHTHLNESQREVESTEKMLGQPTVAYFDSLGLLNPRFVAAHGVWLNDKERLLLAERGANIVHCPTTNLKLASGICDTRALMDAGVTVGLGSDGLPCNNRADGFSEMRTAGLVSRYLRGPESLSSKEIVRMATIGGARALGLEREIGSLEPGKKADLTVLRSEGAEGVLLPHSDPYDALVYQFSSSQVVHVFVDGKPILKDARYTTLNEEEIIHAAQTERPDLIRRANLSLAPPRST